MFNVKFLFILIFFSFSFFFCTVAAGQQFNAAPASVVEVPGLIYQYVSSPCKGCGGGVAAKGEGEGRIT